MLAPLEHKLELVKAAYMGAEMSPRPRPTVQSGWPGGLRAKPWPVLSLTGPVLPALWHRQLSREGSSKCCHSSEAVVILPRPRALRPARPLLTRFWG